MHAELRSWISPTLGQRCRKTCGSSHIPTFLVPSLAVSSSLGKSRVFHDQQTSGARRGPVRSQNQASSSPSGAASKHASRDRQRNPYAAPRRRQDVSSWIQALDVFLPPELRPVESIGPIPPEGHVIPDPAALMSYLRKARTDLGLDLLTYLGTDLGRWQAVAYLTRKILDGHQSQKLVQDFGTSHVLANVSPDSSLDQLSALPIVVKKHERAEGVKSSKPRAIARESVDVDAEMQHGNRDLLAEILQSLGCMILTATDRRGDAAAAIMSHVRLVIAHLHHIDAIPSAVYDHTPGPDVRPWQRPPTLHLLSSRILTSLSDAVWRAHEKAVATEADSLRIDRYYMGHEVPGARWKLRVSELGPEIWMELVLWICVEHRFFLEGAWILAEMKKRSDQSNAWSVINWNAVQDPALRTTHRRARVDWNRVKRRPGGAVSGAEGYRSDGPLVELGERTISSEVVSAFVDGLTNEFWAGGTRHRHKPRNILGLISDLRVLLLRDDHGLGINSWNQMILRIIDSGAAEQDEGATLIDGVLGLAPTYREEEEARNAPGGNSPDLDEQSFATYESAAAIGLLHRTLEERARSGSVRGALRIFERLQSLTDANKTKSIDHFISELTEKDAKGTLRNGRGSPPSEVAGLFPGIPPRILSVFLDLLTEAEVFGFAKWMLYANEIDGPLIPESLYTNQLLIPSLLRFAYATSDSALLSRVVAPLSTPLPPDVARALLHCQISLNRWSSIQDMLGNAKKSSDVIWNAETVTTIARAVLQLEMSIESGSLSESRRSERSEYLEQSVKMLQSLLNGDYGTPTLMDTGVEGYHSTLRRLIGNASPPSSRLLSFKNERLSKSMSHISVEAFNILLRAVSETQGSSRARGLWKTWCNEPPMRNEKLGKTDSSEDGTGLEMELTDADTTDLSEPSDTEACLIVTPNVFTVRIIIQSAVREWRDILQKAKQLNDGHARDGHALQSSLDKMRVTCPGSAMAEPGLFPPQKSSKESVKATDWYSATFNWGAGMFGRFNMSDEEIEEELSECVSRKHGRAQSRWKLRF